MKKILLVLCLSLLGGISGSCYTNVNLRVDTNGALVAPRNFIIANSNAFNTIVDHSGVTNLVNTKLDATNATWSGSEYLRDWNAQVSKISSGAATQAVMCLIGDSWTTGGSITEPLVTNMHNRLGNAGNGFWAAATNLVGHPKGVSYGYVGTWVNSYSTNGASVSAVNSVDTATPASLSLTTRVSRFVIHYVKRPGGGTFTYNLDGAGDNTMDTANASLEMATVNVGTNLSLATNHILRLTITGAGTDGVSINGVDCQNTLAGFRLHNLGYSGSRVADWLLSGTSSNLFQSAISNLEPNIIGILLGTNDKVQDQTPTQYTNNLLTLIRRLRSAKTNVSILLISPGDNAGAGTTAMSYYAEALENLARIERVGFLNGYKLIGPYDEANARGLYANTTHVNSYGGRVIADGIIELLASRYNGAARLGIGTNMPLATLHVAGTSIFDYDVTNKGSIVLQNNQLKLHGSDPTIYTSIQGTGVNPTMLLRTLASFDFQTYYGVGYASRFIIVTNGSVGINTNNPQAKLHVNGNALIDGAITATGMTNLGNSYLGTNGTYWATIDGNTVATNANGLVNVIISTNGSVGLGTSPSGSYKLDTSGEIRVGSLRNTGGNMQFANARLNMGSNAAIAWSGTGAYSGTKDTHLSRLEAGLLSVDTTTWGNGLGSLQLGAAFLQTNAAMPSPLASGTWFWNSNNVIWCISNTKTNLLIDMR
jgi:lysophospholipase L1-like esterase